MPLVTDTLNIPFGGLETKIDPKLVPLGKSLTLENAEFDVLGAISKRNGYTNLGVTIIGDGDYETGRALFAHKNELLLTGGKQLLSRSTTGDGWVVKGDLVSVGVKTRRLISEAGAAQPGADMAIANGIAVYAWQFFGVQVAVVDVATGTVIKGAAELQSTTAVPRVIASGDDIFVVCMDGANVRMYALDTASPATFAAGVNLATNSGGTAAPFDVCSLGSGNAACVYESTTPDVRVVKFNSGGTTSSTTAVVENVASTNFGMQTDASGNIYFIYRQAATGDVRCMGLTSALGLKFAAFTVETLADADYFAGCQQLLSVTWMYQTGGGAGAGYSVRKAQVSSGGVASGVALVAGGVSLASRPFSTDSGTTIYAVMTYSFNSATSTQSCYFLVNTSGEVCARILPGYAMTDTVLTSAQRCFPGSVVQTSAGPYLFAWSALFAQNLLIDSGTMLPVPTSIELDFSHVPTAAPLGENLHIAGGCLYEYDGANVFENNFHVIPEVPTLANNAGGSLADGTYSVILVYGFFDAHGQLHRSAPSVAASITISGGGGARQIDITARCLRLTSKPYAWILAYITEDAGTTYYEAGYVANDAAAATAAITIDDLSDLTDNRLLYTTGGVLDNTAPPHLSSIVRKGERLYGIGPDGQIWLTKKHVLGEGASFADELLTHDITEDGGDDYRLSEQDDALVVWGERSIQAIAGDGPTDVGTQSDLAPPRVLASDTGLLAGSPVVRSDAGSFFKSSRGLSLLSRAMQVAYVGGPVETYNSLELVSAVVVPEKGQIRFGHSDGSTLVYDITAEQWAVFTNHLTSGPACVFDGDYCYVKSSGGVFQQDTGFVDDATAISMVVETPWIRLAALTGYVRAYEVQFLGTWRSAHTLTLKVYVDFSETAVETIEYDLSTGYSAGDALRLGHDLARQKCQAVKFRLEDSAQAGTKESLSLSGMSLLLGGKKGLFKLPASSKA